MARNKEISYKSRNKTLLGILLILSSIVIMLNYGYVSSFFFWVISFFVGGVFTYIVSIILLIYGISFVIKKKITYTHVKFIVIGLSIATLGAYLAITNNMTLLEDDGYLTFTNFSETFVESLELQRFPVIAPITDSCGLIGYLLVAILNSAFTNLGTNIFSSILIIVGTILALVHPIRSLVKSIYSDENRVSKNERAMESYHKDQVADIKPIMPTYKEVTKEESVEPVVENLPLKPQVEEPKIVHEEPRVNHINNYNNYQNSYNNVQTSKKDVYQNTNLEKVKFKFGEDEEETPSVSVEPHSYNNQNYSHQAPSPMPIHSAPLYGPAEDVEEEKEEIKPVSEPPRHRYSSEEVTRLATSKPGELHGEDYNKKEETVAPKAPSFMPQAKKKYRFRPVPVELLKDRKSDEDERGNIEVCEARVEKINEVFLDMDIGARIVSYQIGPSVTRYDVQTERSFSIKGIDKVMGDVSVRLGGINARFVPIVTGKTTSGIELPNKNRSIVNFKDTLLDLPEPRPGKLFIPFGKNISGEYIKADFLEAPHMLVCGTTGSGKSIFMHSFILSIIMRYSPDEVRLVMVDPKRVEFGKYREMPHLLCPVINEPAEANATISKLVDEMEDRFTLLEATGQSNLKQYNEYAKQTGAATMPYIVLIIDEFADLIETSKTIAQPVQRLGQKARAAGIHMVIATQRPDTSVITGAIKANFNTRVALATASATDSVTIIGEGGAEKLLGNGDLLISSPLISKTEKPRVQGCFVDNEEISNVVNYLKGNYPLEYDDKFVGLLEKARLEANDFGTIHPSNDEDERYEEVKRYVMETMEYCSISKIQGTFSFGYPRSSKIFKRLVEEGIIEKAASSNSAKGAKVLIRLGGESAIDKESGENPGTYSQSTFEAK